MPADLQTLLRESPGLDETNPVLVVRALAEQLEQRPRGWMGIRRLLLLLAERGVRLPYGVIADLQAKGLADRDHSARLARPRHGVVGLFVDENRTGFVVPLRVREVSAWCVSPDLPFGASRLRRLLLRLLQAIEPDVSDVPADLAFEVTTPLHFHVPITGPSMDMAALLAAVCSLAEEPAVLALACVVLQPRGRHEEDLVLVGAAEAKLEAFVREYEGGSLLIRPPGCRVTSRFDKHFDETWEVDSLPQLAERLGKRVRAALLRRVELTEERFDARVRKLVRLEEVPSVEALRTGLHLIRGARRLGLAPRRWRAVRRVAAWQLVQLGHYDNARSCARSLYEDTRRVGCWTSTDEQAAAAVGLARVLLATHAAREAADLLGAWHESLAEHPLQASPETRFGVAFGLSEATRLQGEVLDALFAEASRLAGGVGRQARDAAIAAQTRLLLATDRLDEAARHIELMAVGDRPVASRGHWLIAEVRSELARRRGEVWALADERGTGGARPEAARYLLSTAQQDAREPDDRVERCRRASAILKKLTWNLKGPDDLANPHGLLRLLLALILHAETGDESAWRVSKAELRCYVGLPDRPALAASWGREVDELDMGMGPRAVSRLVSGLPRVCSMEHSLIAGTGPASFASGAMS